MIHSKQAQRGGRGIDLPILDPGTKGSGYLVPHPGCFTFRKSLVTYREGGWVDLAVSLDGFKPSTMQPVASCYTNNAILATFRLAVVSKIDSLNSRTFVHIFINV